MHGKSLLLVAVLVFAFLAQPVAAQVKNDNTILVTTNLRTDNGPVRLEMTLVNSGPNVLQLLKGNLPWAQGVGGSQIQLWRARPAFQPLSAFYVISDTDAIVELKSGEALSGSFNLEARFPKLREVLLRGEDVMFFWGYRGVAMPDFSDLPAVEREGTYLTNLVTGTGLIERFSPETDAR